MARARFQKLSPEKQEAILAAAADEFAEWGYGAASLNRIIERAGSSKGSIYYYFEDKADLLLTVVERAVAKVMGEVEFPDLEAFSAETFWPGVYGVFEHAMPLIERDSWDIRIMRSFFRLRDEPGAPEGLSVVLDHSRDIAYRLLRRGIELGVVRTDLPLDLLVDVYLAADQAGDRWMVKHWDDFDAGGRRVLMAARIDLLRDMLDVRHVEWER